MIYKNVSKIDDKLSAIGLGCWNFGGDWDDHSEQTCIEIVHEAIDMGVNFFDVAPVYGHGVSETILGKALKGKRNKAFIASKAGLVWNEKKETKNDLSKKSILEEIDVSLKRLETDYIDLYQMHWPDPSTPLEETAEALNILKKSGKIRYIGLTNYSVADILTMMSICEISSQQGLYNMFERNPKTYHTIPLAYKTEKEIFPLVKKHGQAFLPYSPMFQGLLAGRFLDGVKFSENDVRSANPKLSGVEFEEYLAAANQLKLFSKEIDKPMSQIALNWLIDKEEVTSVIGGVSSAQELANNVACTNWTLDNSMKERIELIIKPFENK